jgi:hypothetical protein
MNTAKTSILICFLLLASLVPKAQIDYFVAFFGEGINKNAPVGHAYIGIGKGVPLTCDLNGSETIMVGFYPKVRTEGGKSLWFGPVDGAIKDDTRSHMDSYVFKKISFADYIKVNLKIEEWKKKKYELTRQDCISFFIDVAKLFSDTKLPDRTKYVIPDTYVKQFILINKLLN